MSRKFRSDDGRFRRMRSEPRRCDYGGKCENTPMTPPRSWSAWEVRNKPLYCLEHLEEVRRNSRLVARMRRIREQGFEVEVTPYGEIIPGEEVTPP